jgi:hypothetical protein
MAAPANAGRCTAHLAIAAAPSRGDPVGAICCAREGACRPTDCRALWAAPLLRLQRDLSLPILSPSLAPPGGVVCRGDATGG